MKAPTTSFRLKPEIINELKAIAEKENRSMANLVETILLSYLKEIKKAKPAGKS